MTSAAVNVRTDGQATAGVIAPLEPPDLTWHNGFWNDNRRSHKTTYQRHKSQRAQTKPMQQLVLPGCAVSGQGQSPVWRVNSVSTPRTEQPDLLTQDKLFDLYSKRLEARTEAVKTHAAYLYQLQTVLRIAAISAGHAVTIAELFQQPQELGHALTDDRSHVTTARLSKWTLAQRRSAIRSAATLLRPELEQILGRSPHAVLNQALRLVAERVGTGYRLTGGRPRQRGGVVPTTDELAAIIAASGQEVGYRGRRNQVFLHILAETGTRVNALRTLDGGDCWIHPSGQVRLRLHEKGKAEPREVELSPETGAALHAYSRAYNQLAVAYRNPARIWLGHSGCVWRNSFWGCWPYRQIVAMLQAACSESHTRTITPHALRRFFATEAASRYPRYIVALAGGWQGLERLDDHYIAPHASDVWRKLAALEAPDASHLEQTEHATSATTPSVS